jgi:hypothetical protein
MIQLKNALRGREYFANNPMFNRKSEIYFELKPSSLFRIDWEQST